MQHPRRIGGQNSGALEGSNAVDLPLTVAKCPGASKQLLREHLTELAAFHQSAVGVGVDRGLRTGTVDGQQRLDRG